MPETFVFSESNEAGEVITDDISNVNLGAIDAPELNPADYPVLKEQNSFSKYIRAKFGGEFTEIDNMKFWKYSGDLLAGESVKAAANVVYATPTQSGTGDSNVPTSLGTALSVNSAEGLPSIIYGESGVSGYSGYIRLQGQTTSETPSGAMNSKTYCYQYDVV